MLVIMKITSNGHTYEVTKHSCTCPDYTYRKAKIGGICKHIASTYYKIPTKQSDTKVMEAFFKRGVNKDSAVRRFGQTKVKQLLNDQVIIEQGVHINRVYKRILKLL